MDMCIKVDGILNRVAFGDYKKATEYVSPDMTIKATYQGKFRGRRYRQHTILITFGKPNYEERQKIKKAIKTKRRFPFIETK